MPQRLDEGRLGSGIDVQRRIAREVLVLLADVLEVIG
jgi:hypothetical protein